MEFLIGITALIGIVWGIFFAKRCSLVSGCVLFLLIGYSLGHAFFHFNLGPIPLTLERIFLIGLVGLAFWHWKSGQLRIKAWDNTDWLLLMLVGLLSCSTFLNLPSEGTPQDGSPIWRLVASYWMPCVLYWIAKNSPLSERNLRNAIAWVVLFGIYLGLTACAEVTHQWWAVFPKYIANPKLGTHFGRARGPTLMAASMGIYLTLGAIAVWYRAQGASRIGSFALYALLPLFAIATYFTYTRSAWLGAAGAMLVIVSLHFHGAKQRALVGLLLISGLLVGVTKWESIMSLKRETSAEDTRHSVEQRESFMYVSWKMFSDRPLLGCGFGRFFDQKLPYLSDRSQKIELDSIRGLQHHNTFLSLLTETGIVGLALFIAVLSAFLRNAYLLARDASKPAWVQAYGVFAVATMVNYLVSAAFHDLSLCPTEHWMVFVFSGFATSLRYGQATELTSVARIASTKNPAPGYWRQTQFNQTN